MLPGSRACWLQPGLVVPSATTCIKRIADRLRRRANIWCLSWVLFAEGRDSRQGTGFGHSTTMNVPAQGRGPGPGRGRAVGNLALALAFLVSGGGTGPWTLEPLEHPPFVISELLRDGTLPVASLHCPLSVHLVHLGRGLSDQERTPNPGRFDSAPSAPATPGCLLLAAGTPYWKRREKKEAWPPRCNLFPPPPPQRTHGCT